MFSSGGPSRSSLILQLESIESGIPKAYHASSKHRALTPGYTETAPTIPATSKAGTIHPAWENQTNSVPTTPGKLESSRPQSPFNVEESTDVVGVKQSIHNPRKNIARLIGACLLAFCQGLSDAAPGALLPYLEKYYNIGHSTASLIFLGNAAGFIIVAFFSQALYAMVGRAWTIVCGASTVAVASLIMGLGLHYASVIVGFFLSGAGMAIVLAQTNVFCSSLAESTVVLGYVHGSYGAGGTAGPIIATAIASTGIKWSYFYFILLGISIFNAIYSGYVFRGSEDAPTIAQVRSDNTVDMSRKEILKKTILNKPTLMASLFIFAYQGAEVTTSGWVVSFLISTRHGDPAAVGYVTAGFWGGITAGRFFLSHACRRFGEKRSVFLLIAGSIIFQALGWQVPNVISNAIFVSIVGLLLGPVYPCTMTVATQLIPSSLHVSSLSFVSAFGSSGGALAPFTTGVLAGKYGAWVLYPVCIFLFAVMEVVWFLLPRVSKRRE